MLDDVLLAQSARGAGMSQGELFLEFVRPIDGLGLRSMLTGSVAATMYGEPRITLEFFREGRSEEHLNPPVTEQASGPP